MREMGLEPTRPIGHKILSLACLPISALPRDKVYISTAEGSWQQLFSFFVLFLGLFLFPSMKGVRPHHGTTMGMLYLRWGQTPRPPGSLWHGLESDPIMVPVRGRFIHDGVRPRSLPEVYGTVWGQTPLWHRYVGTLSTMGSDPLASWEDGLTPMAYR